MLLALLGSLALPAGTGSAATPAYGLIEHYPETNDYAQVGSPVDLAFDSSGNAYVADALLAAVLKFDVGGTAVGHWSTGIPPTSIAVDADDRIYVGTFSHVYVFDASGNPLGSFGGNGSEVGQFRSVKSLAVDDAYIYALDSLNDRVQIFNRSDYAYVGQFGSVGSGDGQFHENHPTDLAIDRDRNVYVADPYNYRIQVFEYDGAAGTWAYFSQIGAEGNGPGQFRFPSALVVQQIDGHLTDVHVYDPYQLGGSMQQIPVVDRQLGTVDPASITQTGVPGILVNPAAQLSRNPASGHFYVSNHRSIVRTDDPANTANWIGLSATRFGTAEGIAIDAAGHAYIADTYQHRLMKYDADGNFMTSWGGAGAGDGEFNQPGGIALDSAGNVYVADKANNRVQKFAPDGTFLSKLESDGGTVLFSNVYDVAVDSSDHLYVTTYKHVYKFAPDGTYVTKWGDPAGGDGDGNFTIPMGIAVDSSDNVYVTDYTHHRVQKFAPDGSLLTKWGRPDGTPGNAPGEFNYPRWIAIDGDDRVLVVDVIGGRVQVFQADGSYLTEFGQYPLLNRPGAVAIRAAHQAAITDLSLNQVRIFQDIGSLVSPLGLTAVGGNRSAALSFAAPAGATSVTVRQSVYGSGVWTEASTSSPLNDASTGAIVTGLADDTRYEFALFIVGGSYQGMTNPAEATTLPAPSGSPSTPPAGSSGTPSPEPEPQETPAEHPPADPATPGEDVPEIRLTDIAGHWAEAYIRQAIRASLAAGYPDHTFRPDRHVTRAEFVSFIAQLQGWEPDNELPLTFKDERDIPQWARGFIARAAEEQVIAGYADGTFRAAHTISRAEAVSIVARLLGLPPLEGEPDEFADDRLIPAWAKEHVYAAVGMKIVAGRGNHLFVPGDPITRAETVVLLWKVREAFDERS